MFVLTTLAAILASLAYYVLAMPSVRPHRGDGHFENRSFRYLGKPIPGYTIDFPTFDLSTAYDATYHLENLPDLSNNVGVYLSITDPSGALQGDKAQKSLAGDLQIDVQDEQGKPICHVHHPLGKMIWAAPEGGDYGLYDLDKSFFVPRQGARYDLRIRYSPDPNMPRLKGFLHIRCGGSI